MQHLEEDLIRRFGRLKASRAENRIVVAHLLEGCPTCAVKVRRALFPPISEAAYEEVFAKLRVPKKRLGLRWATVLPFRERPPLPPGVRDW